MGWCLFVLGASRNMVVRKSVMSMTIRFAHIHCTDENKTAEFCRAQLIIDALAVNSNRHTLQYPNIQTNGSYSHPPVMQPSQNLPTTGTPYSPRQLCEEHIGQLCSLHRNCQQDVNWHTLQHRKLCEGHIHQLCSLHRICNIFNKTFQGIELS